MKQVIALLLAIAMTAGASAAEVDGNSLLWAGTFRWWTTPAPPDADDPGFAISTIGPRPLKRTDEIVADVGVRFGIVVKIVGTESEGTRVKDLRFVIHYPSPGLVDPRSGKRTLVDDGPWDCFYGVACTAVYRFESAEELLPGKWTFEIFSGDKLLAEHTFNVRASRPRKGDVSACASEVVTGRRPCHLSAA